MPQKRRAVQLTKTERALLEKFVAQGKRGRGLSRAPASSCYSEEGRKEREIMAILGVSRGTVYNVRKKYRQKQQTHILDLLQEAPRSGRPVKFDSRVAANVTMIACSAPPQGRGRWTLRLLADKVVN